MNLSFAEDEQRGSSPDDQLLNQTELARIFNISRNVVIERIEEAGIEPVSRGRGGTKYRFGDVKDVINLKYVKSDKKTEFQERKLGAEARLKEIQVGEREGSLIDISEIELGATQFFRALYNSFMVYFADSALDISRLRTRGEVEAYQKEHGGKILLNLRDDPNNALARHILTEEE